MTMVANPRWGGRRGNVREITVDFRIQGARINDLWTAGRVDVLATPFAPDEGEDDDCVDFAPSLGTSMLGFRTDREMFRDVRVRRAVAAALAPVGGTFAEHGLVSRPAMGGGLLPPAMPGHDHRVCGAPRPRRRPGTSGRGRPSRRRRAAPARDAAHEGIRGARARHRERARPDRTRCRLRDQRARVAHVADPGRPVVDVRGSPTTPTRTGSSVASSPTPVTRVADEEKTRELVDLLNQARASRNQDERLELYGRVDRLLVAEWVILMPVAYLRTGHPAAAVGPRPVGERAHAVPVRRRHRRPRRHRTRRRTPRGERLDGAGVRAGVRGRAPARGRARGGLCVDLPGVGVDLPGDPLRRRDDPAVRDDGGALPARRGASCSARARPRARPGLADAAGVGRRPRASARFSSSAATVCSPTPRSASRPASRRCAWRRSRSSCRCWRGRCRTARRRRGGGSARSWSGSPAWRCWSRSQGTGGGLHPGDALLLLGSALSWAAGTVATRVVPVPRSPTMGAAMPLLAGGVILTLVAIGVGRALRRPPRPRLGPLAGRPGLSGRASGRS